RGQRVHYPDPEKCPGNPDKGGNRSYRVFPVILGNREERRAFDGTPPLHGKAVEPLLGDYRQKSRSNGHHLRRRVFGIADGCDGFIEYPAAGAENDEGDEYRGKALRLAVTVGMALVVRLSPNAEGYHSSQDGNEVAGALDAVGKYRLGTSVVSGKQLHDHQKRIYPETNLDYPVCPAEPLSPLQSPLRFSGYP